MRAARFARNFLLRLLVAALVCVCVLTARAQDGGAGERGVRGVVVDEGGAAVVGASVLLRVADTVGAASAKTDADGRFDFGVPPSRAFTLTVVARGFAAFERSWKAGEWDGSALRVVLAPAGYEERV